MKLFVDLDTLQLIEGPGFRNPVESLRFKRGDAARLDVMFLIGGSTPTTIGNPTTLEIHFGAKLKGQYGADYLVHTSAWTLPAPAATTPVYSCSPSFNTTALNEALNLGGNESAEIALMGEITWREGTSAPTSTRTVQVVVDNDVNRGTEGTPLGGQTPESWLDARAEIKLTCGTPGAGPIYDVTIAGRIRVLSYVNGTVWSDGIAESPFNSIILNMDGSGAWTLTDLAAGCSWTSNVSATPVGVTWTLATGSSSDTPMVAESTTFPRFFHDWATNRTWIVPSANADFFELMFPSPDAIAAALGYTPADDASVVHRTGPETLSGQLELTGQSTTNATSALTVGLRPVARAQNIAMRFGGAPPVIQGSGGGRSAYGMHASSDLTSAAAGSYSALHYGYLQFNTTWSGSGMNFSAPWLASGAVLVKSLATTTAIRFIVGQSSAVAPSLSNQNFAASKAVAVEIYNDAGTAKARILSHNGTAASASGTTVSLGAISTMFTNTIRFALKNFGNGTYKLWIGSVASANAPTPLNLAASADITITTGPVGAGSIYCHLMTVAHVTSSATGGGTNEAIFVLNYELEYLP